MYRRKFLAGAFAAVPAVAESGSRARAAQISWKFGFPLTADHPVNVRAVEAFARIRRETDGQLDITSFPNAVLGNSDSMVGQLRLGAIEMMAGNGGIFDSIVPVAAIEGIAFAFPDSRAVLSAMDGDLGKVIRPAFVPHGMYVLDRIFEVGFRHFTTSTKPVRNVNDLQGLKLRVAQGKLYLDTFRSLGATTAAVNGGDLYVALQTHLVDAQETPLSFIESQRIYEVQKYCSLTRHMWTGYWMVLNLAKWQSLPAKLQEIVQTNLARSAVAERRDSAAMEGALRDRLHRQGLTFNDDIDVASFKAKLASAQYYARWRNEYGDATWAILERYGGRLG